MPVVVAHVTWSLGWGGLERVVLDLCRSLDRERWQPLVVTFTDLIPRAEQFAAADIPIATVTQHGFDPTLPHRLARLFRDRNVGLVNAHNFGRYLYAGPAARLAGLPSIYTEHSRTLRTERALWQLQPRVSRLADRVVAVSESLRTFLISQLRLPPERVDLIPNGIDIDVYAGGNRARARAELGLRDDEPVIGHVGRLVPVKNHRLLLAAYARLTATPSRLLLVGDGPERPALEQEVARLGLSEQVTFLGIREDVADLLAAMDLFVLSSHSEGLPLAILEAMAAGLPVVATEAAGQDVVTPATGRLVPNDDPARLAAAMAELIDDPARRARLGAAAAAEARRRYSLQVMADSYAALYRQLAPAGA